MQLNHRVNGTPPTTDLNPVVYLSMPTTFTTLWENLRTIKRAATDEQIGPVNVYLSAVWRDMDRFENDFLHQPPAGLGLNFLIAFTRLKATIEAFLAGG